jgi:hypothetical protein
MMNAVVAENEAHARAMVKWLGLDPDLWLTLPYGAPVDHLLFKDVFIVRPHEGVEEWQGDWFVENIIGRTAGRIQTLPEGWSPAQDEPRRNELPLVEAKG